MGWAWDKEQNDGPGFTPNIWSRQWKASWTLDFLGYFMEILYMLIREIYIG